MESLWFGKKIIVVDDSEMVRNTLSNIYSEIGLEVVGEAQGGVSALKLVDEVGADFVSLDIIMPDMHGIECYRKLKKTKPELKLFFVSCLSHDSKFIAAFKNEIASYCFIEKPPRLETLKLALDKIYSGVLEKDEDQEILDDKKLSNPPEKNQMSDVS